MKRIITFLMALFLVAASENFALCSTEVLSEDTKELMSLHLVNGDENGIIKEDEIIKYIECLAVIDNINGKYTPTSISVDSTNRIIKEDLPDWQIKILYNYLYIPLSVIINDDEWQSFDPNANCTQKDAIMYAIRLTADTDSCFVYDSSYYNFSTEDAYLRAFKKGLIDSPDIQNANNLITRKEYFKIINKCLYIRYMSGGYAPRMVRLIDGLIKPEETVSEFSYEDDKNQYSQQGVKTIKSDYKNNLDVHSAYGGLVDYSYDVSDNSKTKCIIQCAQEEVDVKYKEIKVSWDGLDKVWRISFLWESQSAAMVYVKPSLKTILIAYSE